MLPVVVVEIPCALHGIEIALVAGGAVDVEIGFEVGDEVVVRAVVGVLPDDVLVVRGEALEPIVFLIVALNDLDVFRLADGGEDTCGCWRSCPARPACRRASSSGRYSH